MTNDEPPKQAPDAEPRPSTAPSEDERRVHPRYDLLAQVAVRHGAVDHVLEILNLSRGGALLDLVNEPRPRWLDLRRSVDVRIFGREGRVLVEAHGVIVRIAESVETRTFAVQFDALLDDELVRTVLRDVGRPPPLPSARDSP